MMAEEIEGINYTFNLETKEATVIESSSRSYSGEVVIPKSVEYDGTVYNVTSIGSSAFAYFSSLTSASRGQALRVWWLCFMS